MKVQGRFRELKSKESYCRAKYEKEKGGPQRKILT